MVRIFRSPLLWLLIVYYAVSAVTLLAWDTRGVYAPTGDEPHYLVIADALVTDGSAEVTASYRREFDDPRWYAAGLAEPGAALVPPAAHVVPTGGGFHSWHGTGIAAWVALPAEVLGITGARWAMVVIASITVVFSWVLAGRFLSRPGPRTGGTAAVALAFPVLLAGTQIYPDVPAGVLLLGVLTWWMIPEARRSPAWTLVAAIAAAAVPWMGSRFILPGAVALVAMVWAVRRHQRLVVAVVGPAIISAGALSAYHLWAFGNILGSPTEGTLVFGRDFLLVLPGLLMDQNQGFLWGNPVLWAAIPGLVILWRGNRSVVVLWGALAVTLWIPAAAHPGLYGLGSFNGRYAWALALLACLPAMAGLGALWQKRPRLFWAAIVCGIAFQIYLVALSVAIGGTAPGSPAGLDLYTRPENTWLESYSAWWFPFQDFLPAWYNPEWAFSFWPNWVWLLFLPVVVALSFSHPNRRTRVTAVTAVGVVAAVVVAGLVSSPGTRVLEQGDGQVLVGGVDRPGYPVVGPAQLMRFGTYAWFVEYAAEGAVRVGKWELVRAADNVVVAAGELAGTNGTENVEEFIVSVRSLEPREYFWRIGWYGERDLEIAATGVRYG